MVVLHWICENGRCNQFVKNKIRGHPEMQWRHVPTCENRADLASRGGPVNGSQIWWDGLEWLADTQRSPKNRVTQKSQASEAEAKVIKDENLNDNIFENLLKRHDLRRSLCIQRLVDKARAS